MRQTLIVSNRGQLTLPASLRKRFGIKDGGAIILEAALSFLGFGVVPPTPAWGQMAADGGRSAVSSGAYWLVLFPSAALILTVLSVNFLGDGLRDALDPTQSIERK
jgi:peptide/nickel transport system permease protein